LGHAEATSGKKKINGGDHMSKAAAVAGVFSRMNSVSARYSVFYVSGSVNVFAAL